MSEPKVDGIIVCGTGWGIGSYRYINEDGFAEWGYGFARPENPYDYHPDSECCTPEEIAAWESAKVEWDKLNGSGQKETP